jgi:hypothetical protein
MKKLAILIAILLVLGGLVLVSSTTPTLTMYSQPLDNNNTNWTWRTTNLLGMTEDACLVSMQPLSGIYQFNNNPAIITSAMTNGMSSQFGDTLNIIFVSQSGSTQNVYISWNISMNEYKNGQLLNYENVLEGYYNFTLQASWLTTGINYINETALTNEYFTQNFQGIATIYMHIVWWDGTTKEVGNIFRQVYVVSGGATIYSTPTIQQDNGVIHFYGITGFGKFYISIFNPYGTIVSNISVPMNTQYNISWTVPSNAFVSGGNNIWSATIENAWVYLHQTIFFTVDNIQLAPPKPIITILNQPSLFWNVNNIVNVHVYAPNNPNSINPVQYILVYVYIGNDMPPVGSGNWIIYHQEYATLNNNATFSFQITSKQNYTIAVASIDSDGRSSGFSYYSININNIEGNNTSSNGGLQPVILFYAIIISMIISAIFISAIIFLFLPFDIISRVIILIGFMIFMIFLTDFLLLHYLAINLWGLM